MKRVRVVLSPEAEEVYRHLNAKAQASKLERSIFNAINKKVGEGLFLRMVVESLVVRVVV